MARDSVPEFAIMGHPNEGKSSVVSTLSEDDSVPVSPVPGETVECQIFPVKIDGREQIRFIDTPGFQSPKKTLAWMKNYRGPDEGMVQAFCEANRDDPNLSDECELLRPIAEGAGIIYVADASRPMRKVDRLEMEILRMTGQPRMAIINCKDREENYLDEWKSEFRKHFNAIRVFNAHNATYAERISLLENLKSIDQDWQPALEKVIEAFKRDWDRRNVRSAALICDLLQYCLELSVTRSYSDKSRGRSELKKLQTHYKSAIETAERNAHQQIRKLFKHNIFQFDLPEYSIVNEQLFAGRSWQVLGLSRSQLAAAAAIGGGVVGACLDAAAAGLTFGIFTAIGSAVAAGSAYFGGEQMVDSSVVGLKLGGYRIQVGPNENIQFLYVLLDRALIYYSHIINWAHGRRGGRVNDAVSAEEKGQKVGFTSAWDDADKKVCQTFSVSLRSEETEGRQASRKALFNLIKNKLDEISRSERKMV